MLTIFSVPKPFRGQEEIIQRNAIKSWLLLDPSCEIILFGDEFGTKEIAKEFSVLHEQNILKNQYGTPVLSFLFKRAQEISTYDFNCYLNCDIILMQDFMVAMKQINLLSPPYLAVGRRWNLDIDRYLDFSQANWEDQLKRLVLSNGQEGTQRGIDYFAFSKGVYRDIIPFSIGRAWWDNWLVWKACSINAKVVDISSVTMVVHQNHTYSYYPGGLSGILHGPEGLLNLKLSGGWRHSYTLEAATHILSFKGIENNLKRYRFFAIREIKHLKDVIFRLIRSLYLILKL